MVGSVVARVSAEETVSPELTSAGSTAATVDESAASASQGEGPARGQARGAGNGSGGGGGADGAEERDGPGAPQSPGGEGPPNGGPPVGETAQDLVDMKIRRLLASGKREAALDQMAREYQRLIYSTAFRILGSAAQAQDALQDTFLAALTDVDGYQGRAPIRAWLLRICAHRAIDLARRERRSERWKAPEELADDVPEATAHAPPVRLDEQLWCRALEECLFQLPLEARAALVMRFQHGMSYEEIGEICGEKAGTLQARVTRAMPQLRRCLAAKGWER